MIVHLHNIRPFIGYIIAINNSDFFPFKFKMEYTVKLLTILIGCALYGYVKSSTETREFCFLQQLLLTNDISDF